MKNKKLWLSCLLLLFSAIKTVTRRKGKKETVYTMSFVVKEPDEESPRISACEASERITTYLTGLGFPFTEYKTFETDGKTETDTREVLTYFLMMLTEAQAEEILESLKMSLGLKTAFCTKETYSYQELKKQMA